MHPDSLRNLRVGIALVAASFSGCSASADTSADDDTGADVTGAGDQCPLDREIERQCGADALDCGRTDDDASKEAVDACVVSALNGDGAFVAIYASAGDDSQVAEAICRRTDGVVLILFWDSDPSGGSQTGAEIDATRCDGATATAVDASGGWPLACAEFTDLGPVCE